MKLMDLMRPDPVAVAFGVRRGGGPARLEAIHGQDSVALVSPVGDAAEILAATPVSAGVLSAADKTRLDSLSGSSPGAGPTLFGTEAEVEAAAIPAAADFLRVAGRAAPGDGGEALYVRTPSEPAHEGKLLSADGAWWEKVPGRIIQVPTIAALTALPSSRLADGAMARVDAYDAATGAGGGWFRWEAESAAATDGGVTFVPDDLTAAASEYLLESGNFNGVNSYRQLPHTDIVWGSVSITYDNETKTLDSEWLHGHSTTPRAAYGNPPIESPTFDHANGRLYTGGSWFKMRRLIRSNVNTNADPALRTAKLNYRYATGAGRWVREIGDHVTPAMFGAKPDDATFDCSFAICWALTWLNGQDRVKTLRYDRLYWIKGYWGDVYSGIRQIGRGLHTPCVKYAGDAGGGSGGVADFLKNEFIDDGSPEAQANNSAYYLLDLHRPGQIAFDKATGFAFEDFCVHGNAGENLYFLDDVSGAYDTETISQRLRESPSHHGFFFINQSGRAVAIGASWSAHRCQWRDMLGSCVAYASGGFMNYSDLWLGNSVSGRVFYGGQGQGSGITLFGYTRSSFWTPYSGQFQNVRIVDVVENPWPDNDLAPDFMVLRGENYRGMGEELYGGTAALDRYGASHLGIGNFTVDMGSIGVSAIKTNGGRADFAHGRVLGPSAGTFWRLFDNDTGNQVGGSTVALRSIEAVNRLEMGAHLLRSPSGYYDKLLVEDVHLVDAYIDGQYASYTDDFTQPRGNVLEMFNMKVQPGTGEPPVEFQEIELRGVTSQLYHQYFAMMKGAGDADAVPTLIRVVDCRFPNLMKNKLFRDAVTNVTFGDRLKIELIDTAFPLWDSGKSGTENWDALILDMVTMRGCWNPHNGRRSEVDQIETITVAAGTAPDGEIVTNSQVYADAVNAAGYIEVPINLMWLAMSYGVTPISADARTLGYNSLSTHIPVSPLNAGYQNATDPRIRIHVGPVTAGNVLTYRIEAAVAPPRAF